MQQLFSNGMTLLGCSGSNFSQKMVDGWLEGVSKSVNETMNKAETALEDSAPGHVNDSVPDHARIPAGDVASSQGTPMLQTAWLSLVEAVALSWLRRPLLMSMRMSVPVERHSRFYTYFGKSVQVRTQLKMENRFLGYVCLIDRGIIRWMVHSSAVPSAEEVSSLAALIVRTHRSREQRSKRR